MGVAYGSVFRNEGRSMVSYIGMLGVCEGMDPSGAT